MDIGQPGTPNLFNFFWLNNTVIFALVFFIIPLVYCTVASLLFHPKRIVSPINVQIGTFVVFTCILIYSAITEGIYTVFDVAFWNLLIGLIFFAFFGVSIGFIQFFMVRWVVGLNFGSVEQLSYEINSNPKEVLKVLGKDFLIAHALNRKKGKENSPNPIWIMKCRDKHSHEVILAIGKHPEKENTSILTSIAFRTRFDCVSKSHSSSVWRDSIINDLEKRLEKDKFNFVIIPLKNIDDTVSTRAHNHATAITLSKTSVTSEFFRNIPRYYLYMIIITVFTFIGTVILFLIETIDSNTFVGTIVVVTIALFIELGLSLKDELAHRKIEELD